MRVFLHAILCFFGGHEWEHDTYKVWGQIIERRTCKWCKKIESKFRGKWH
jgi:hypothetical protein